MNLTAEEAQINWSHPHMKKHQKLDLTTQIILTYFYVSPHAALEHFISGFPDLLNPNLTLAEERHIGFQS